jgi:intraflagellar transport protein 80
MQVFVDRNRDLYITPVLKPQVVKMGSMCDSVVWHESTDMLAAMVDQKLVVWYYPGAIFVDKDLVHLTKFVKETGCVGFPTYHLLGTVTSLVRVLPH